jgi:hypothetical protein
MEVCDTMATATQGPSELDAVLQDRYTGLLIGRRQPLDPSKLHEQLHDALRGLVGGTLRDALIDDPQDRAGLLIDSIEEDIRGRIVAFGLQHPELVR